MDEKIIKNMTKHNENLSQYACRDADAIRIKESRKDFRPAFFRDIDKIIYSLSYIRYINKTQVFSNSTNDLISKRITHVQMVSKIARTIGRALNLNEDLIEAASLGHDLGHVPYGHVGEKILNKISIENKEGFFNHNVQSVRTLINIENGGLGSNITLQVLDAIMCHNGETLKQKYFSTEKSIEEFFKEYEDSYTNEKILKNIKPMTLEGCVVKISDVIAYVGKDIEDAMRLGIVSLSDIPLDVSKVLGNTNSDIVNTIVVDIIKNSFNKNYICMSKNIFDALNKLIDFNYKNIYSKANTAEDIKLIELKFKKLFELYCDQISNNKNNEDIYLVFLNDMSSDYLNNTSVKRKVIDYISGMTDEYFELQYSKYFN